MEQPTLHKINPSLYNITERLQEVKKTIRTKGSRDGVYQGHEKEIYLDERIVTYEDNESYVKLSRSGIKALEFLNKKGLLVLRYILLHCIEYGKHKFIFVPKKCSEVTQTGEDSISRGIKNLIEEDWIYKADMRPFYWINVGFVHQGSLDKMVEEHIKTVMR